MSVSSLLLSISIESLTPSNPVTDSIQFVWSEIAIDEELRERSPID
ncbi:hypothetical protein QUB70_08915 [Microcoleus sp. A003_D6]